MNTILMTRVICGDEEEFVVIVGDTLFKPESFLIAAGWNYENVTL